MPPVIAVVAAVFFEAVVAKVIITAIIVGLSYYQQARARRKSRDAYNQSLKDRLVMTATVDQPRTRCYGRVRNVDGVVFKGTWGDKKQFYTLVISLCGHEIDGVERVMFGDTELVLDGSGRVLTAPWGVNVKTPYVDTIASGSNSATLPRTPDAGTVVGIVEKPEGDETVAPTVSGNTVTFPSGLSGFFKRIAYQFSEQGSRAVVTIYNGGDGQDLSAALATRFPGQIIPGAHKFAGMACLLVELAYDQDAFPNGVPNPITAVFRGAKVYDPRTGTTAWTENPALIARDWSLHANGGGCSPADLVSEDFIAAANACDVSHAFTSVNGSGSSTTTTRPMYTCGIVCDTSAKPMETLSAICESMAGDFAWPGGKLSVRAGAYTMPAWTIDGDWLSDKGQIEMVKDAPRSELINIITPTIANSANRYIAAPLPRVVADAYVAVDGEEYPQEIQLEGVTDSDHAAHVSSVMLKDARAAKTYTLPCNLKGLQVKVGQNVTVNVPEIGLSNEVMRCVGWKLDFEQSCCYLTLKSTSAAIFDPDATFKRDDALPSTSLPNPFLVPDVTGLSVASGTAHLFVQSDGTIVTRALVSWTRATDEAVLNGGSVDVRYGTLDKTPDQWQIANVPGSDAQVYLTGLEDERGYGFMVRFRNKLVGGAWSKIQVHTVVGKSQPPAAVAGLSAVQNGATLRINRTPSAEPDWDSAIYEYAVGPGYDTYLPIPAVSDRSGADWDNPAVGALRIRARDVDTSGNPGAPVTYDVTVAAYVGQGDALNFDPYCSNSTSWEAVDGPVRQEGTGIPGARGTSLWRKASAPADGFLWTLENIPIVASRTYNLSANLFADASNTRPMQLVVRMFRANGSELTGADTGWGGGYAGYAFTGLPTTGSFNSYGADFGAGISGRPIPSDVSYCRIGIRFQSSSAGSGFVDQAAQYIRLVDVTDARTALSAAYTAIANAATAQATADGKIDSFYQTTPPTTFSNGDIWFDTDDGNKQYVAVSGAWVLARDTGIGQAITAAAGAQATADGKITTYYASAAPGGAHAVGDLWFNTTDKRVYRWDGGAWVAQRAVGSGDIGTGELGNQAATEVYQDNIDLGGPTIPALGVWSDLRTFTVTPPVNCTLNFSALLDSSVNFDAGTSRIRWAYSAGGGGDAEIATAAPQNWTSSTFIGRTGCQLSIAATAGVAYVFKVQGFREDGSHPSARARLSQMKAEVIKR